MRLRRPVGNNRHLTDDRGLGITGFEYIDLNKTDRGGAKRFKSHA